ncbi:hypothetical protein RD792_017021 [Penstemon davidsonii]|uniref:Tetrahydrofolate dehydrogenase/cyclohydrolase catalytic domain-containing protein n=1 Tax=Penstemon davidsonii TaxID=160366 RepID=A0ABR0CL17_9LAMI|nr:hypothetical protein RD792_017021 [Penstemon davidsonii]
MIGFQYLLLFETQFHLKRMIIRLKFNPEIPLQQDNNEIPVFCDLESNKVSEFSNVNRAYKYKILVKDPFTKGWPPKVPGLAVVIVGKRKDSQSYVTMKRKACAEVGIKSFDLDLPEEVSYLN